MEALFIFAAVFLLVSLFLQGTAAVPVEDKRALLDFINNVNLSRSRSLNWNASSSVCNNWSGVTCSTDKSRVISVRLPGVGFHGRIPANTLSRLSALQTLSLQSNSLTGSFPSDFSKLKNLSFLYLQLNNFSGPLPLDFSVWKNLTNINLSNNGFNGSIPSSISNLTQLTALNLGNNSLSGKIPDLHLSNLQQLNLANNSLTGTVPKLLQRFPSSAFSGNNLSSVDSSPPISSLVHPPASQTSPRSSRNAVKLSESTIVGIILGGCVLGFVTIAFLLFVCCKKQKGGNGFPGKSSQKGERSPETATPGSQDGNNRLVFFEGCNCAFDLEDLLTASSEVLGKGTYGVAYKANLEDATTLVVKRLKEVGLGKRDFEQQMEVLGTIRHENVVELRAYYYSKDEKLMVYDYYSQGSVSALLHGKRGENNRVPLDWDTRLGIVIGTARGIACIHTHSSGKLVHGNIKSSNIFLNSKNYGCVSDLGLTTLMSPVALHMSRSAGYRAPEVIDTRKAFHPSDVYSFGVLLLELLTGKSPVSVTSGDQVVHLVRWVQSIVREEWTAEVFDLELLRYPNIEEEMVEMLQIAMACVARMPERRPKMMDVVKMVEDIRRVDTGNRSSSEIKSEGSTPPP